MTEKPETVEDGFGSVWVKCKHPLCDLEVVRPGKCQCSDWCDFVDALGDPETSSRHVDALIERIQTERDYYEGQLDHIHEAIAWRPDER